MLEQNIDTVDKETKILKKNNDVKHGRRDSVVVLRNGFNRDTCTCTIDRHAKKRLQVCSYLLRCDENTQDNV